MPASSCSHEEGKQQSIQCNQNAGKDNRSAVADDELAHPGDFFQCNHPERRKLHSLVSDTLLKGVDILCLQPTVFTDPCKEELHQHSIVLSPFQFLNC